MKLFLDKLGPLFTSRWIYLALMVPVLIVALAAAVLIWPINYAEGPYRPDPYRKYATPSTLTSLLNDDSLAGQSVYLNEVRLVPGPQENQFVAYGAAGNPILVIAAGQKTPLPKTSVIANVQGLIRRLPSTWTLKHVWKLDAKQLKAFSDDQYYIAAQRIRVDSRRPTND